MFFINRLYSRLITKAICISSFSLLALLAQLSLSGCISTHQERSLASVLADINRNALEKDYNLNTREKLNETWNIYPLSIAALENQPLTVTMLLNKGADIDASIQDLNKIASMQVPYLSYSRNRIMYDKANSAIERLNQLKLQQVKPVNNNSLSVRTQEEITIKPVADELLNIKTKPGKPAGKYDVAVVIGNANYSSTGTPNVDFAIQDAQVMRQYLIKAFGYDPSNIIYIENATLTKLNEVLAPQMTIVANCTNGLSLARAGFSSTTSATAPQTSRAVKVISYRWMPTRSTSAPAATSSQPFMRTFPGFLRSKRPW